MCVTERRGSRCPDVAVTSVSPTVTSQRVQLCTRTSRALVKYYRSSEGRSHPCCAHKIYTLMSGHCMRRHWQAARLYSVIKMYNTPHVLRCPSSHPATMQQQLRAGFKHNKLTLPLLPLPTTTSDSLCATQLLIISKRNPENHREYSEFLYLCGNHWVNVYSTPTFTYASLRNHATQLCFAISHES